MEKVTFLQSESRRVGFSPLWQYHKEMNQKVGLALLMSLLILEQEENPRIVFNTMNLTNNLAKNEDDLAKNGDDEAIPSEENSVSDPEKLTPHPRLLPPHFTEPCLLTSPHIYTPPSSGREDGSSSSDSALQMSVCVKHGNIAFLSYDYIRSLPEYTGLIYHFPVFEQFHIFENCILEFPFTDQGEYSSAREPSYAIARDGTSKNCKYCGILIREGDPSYMHGEDTFCTEECKEGDDIFQEEIRMARQPSRDRASGAGADAVVGFGAGAGAGGEHYGRGILEMVP